MRVVVSSLIVSLSLIVLLTSGTQAKPMLYEAGDWKTLWWYPKQASAPVLGTQVKVEDAAPRIPHLVFVPAGVPPEGGWPVIVFLHGQGESSPSPLEGVALQGPPQHAGRHANSLPFAVISPQKPMGSQFFDDDVAAAIAATIRHYLATQPLDARRGLALAPRTDPGHIVGPCPEVKSDPKAEPSASLSPRRVYLTGVSQGGIGTWGLASDPRHVGLFAAIAPVCGGFPDRCTRAPVPPVPRLCRDAPHTCTDGLSRRDSVPPYPYTM